MKRGCLAPRLTGTELPFGDYVDYHDLVPPPNVIHNPLGVAQSQGYLGNDNFGDCVNVSMLRLRQRQVSGFVPTDTMALADYEITAGYNPSDPQATDVGNDPLLAAAAWLKGLPGAGKIAGYITLDLSDATELVVAISLFKGVMACLAMPPDAEDAFPAPWTPTTLGGPAGAGHCLLLDGFDQTAPDVNFDRCTWASWTQGGVNATFLAEYGFCGLTAVTTELLAAPPPGFDAQKLLADLKQTGQLEN